MVFEANQGQTDLAVKFISWGGGYTLFLALDEAVLALHPASAPGSRAADMGDSEHLRMRLVGGSPTPEVVGVDEIAARSNYLAGSDPSAWAVDVPMYRKIIYRDVYPGIDLAYYGDGDLEFDFIVGPGADAGAIEIDFDGAASVELDKKGDLIVRTARAELKQLAPVIYQADNGSKRSVEGGYCLDGRSVGFWIGDYDASLPLVIDLVLAYSSYLGGSGYDRGIDIAVYAAGNAYVTGWTQSLDFPTTTGAFDTAGGATTDIFVAKCDPSQAGAASLVYATYLGGSGVEDGVGIAVYGNQAYVAGDSASTDFPTTAGAYQPAKAPQLPGSPDAFLTVLDSSGSSLVYSTYFGHTNGEETDAAAVDQNGNAYVTGRASSTGFPTRNPVQTQNNGIFDVFVTKLDSPKSGDASLVYSTYLGGFADESGRDIDVDFAGNAYVTGDTNSNDLVGTPQYDGYPVVNPLSSSLGGSRDAFVSKLDPAGSALVYSTYLGGASDENGVALEGGIVADTAANAYVTGTTGSVGLPDHDRSLPDQSQRLRRRLRDKDRAVGSGSRPRRFDRRPAGTRRATLRNPGSVPPIPKTPYRGLALGAGRWERRYRL